MADAFYDEFFGNPPDTAFDPVDPNNPSLDDVAGNPKRVKTGAEEFEEHALKDQIDYQRYQKQQEAQAAEPTEGQVGLPIFRARLRHGRP